MSDGPALEAEGYLVEATDVARGGEAPQRAEERSGLDRYFRLTERGTTVGTEVKAGLATFMVMSYILDRKSVV